MGRVETILERFDKQYGIETICYLDHNEPWQLLIAVMLSAQCTDARVNLVTPALFQKYSDLEQLSEAKLQELENIIHSTGFYHAKAKNIIASAKILVSQYDSKLPDQIEKLIQLPGVGRKTANVILGNIYHQPSIVVDTHVKRISKRLELATSNDPEKIEYELQAVLPKDHWTLYNMHVITFGRTICTARSPKCALCFLQDICEAKENSE